MASVKPREWTKADGSIGRAWVVRYVDAGGIHRQKTFARQREASAYRSKIETENRAGLLAPEADKLTIGKVALDFASFMDQRQRDGRIGETHRRRVVDQFMRLYILPYLSNVRLSGANLTLLSQWNADIQRDRCCSPYTARQAAQVLKMFYDFAMRRQLIGRNPVLPLLGELRGIDCPKVRTFTVQEMRAVLTASGAKMYRGRTADGNLRMQCAVHLAAFCGLRIAEIFGLHIDNIDFEARQIRIERSFSRHDGMKSPKSAAGRRTIAMPDHVAVLLRAWIERHMKPRDNGTMFARRDGKPFQSDSFRPVWGSLLRRAGLSTDARKPTFHFHALRHFAASWMIDSGWTLPEVARAIGHSRVDMTLTVYAHALTQRVSSPDHMQAISDRLLGAPATTFAHELRTAA